MIPQSRDTHPKAEAVLIELLRQMTPERRLELGLRFSQETLRIARQGIAGAYPHLSEQEQKLMFVEITYGKELADRVRKYLAERQR